MQRQTSRIEAKYNRHQDGRQIRTITGTKNKGDNRRVMDEDRHVIDGNTQVVAGNSRGVDGRHVMEDYIVGTAEDIYRCNIKSCYVSVHVYKIAICKCCYDITCF